MSALSLPFMQTALACALLEGAALSLLGLFVLQRRVAFAGLAVSQLAALGSVVGIVLGLHLGAVAWAVGVASAGLLLLAGLERVRRVPQDVWIATLYVLAAGSSVLLLSKAPHGEAHTMSLFFGNILALDWREAAEAGLMLAVTGGALGAWRHRWIWLSYDPVSAEVAGIRTQRWNAAFIVLFTLAMTLGIHQFGVLLAFAYLLLPASAALLLAPGMRSLLVAVPALSAAASVAGLLGAFWLDLPAGPFLAALMAAATLAAGLLRLLRG